MLARSQAAIPDIIDQANATGDYSEVDRANDVMGRLGKLADHHVQMIQQAQQEDQSKGLGMPQTANPSAPGSNLPALDPQDAQKRQVAGTIDDSINALQQRTAGPSSLPPPVDSASPSRAEMLNQPSSLPPNAAGAALDDVLKTAQDVAIPREQAKNKAFQDREELGRQFEANMRPESSLPTQAPQGESQTPTALAQAAAPALAKEYGNDPNALLQDFASTPGMSKYDQEFAHRVQMEIGDRPQHATIAKVLTALAVGVGSTLGSWISKKYEGGSIIDQSGDEKEWDARKAEIGREVYGANKREEQAQGRGDQGMERVQAQETGKDNRQIVSETGKKTRLDTAETAKDKREVVAETGKNARQQKSIDAQTRIANIRAASAKHGDQMSVSDKAELAKLGKAYGGIDRTLMTVDPKVKAQGDQVLDKMEAIIKKYRDQGK